MTSSVQIVEDALNCLPKFGKLGKYFKFANLFAFYFILVDEIEKLTHGRQQLALVVLLPEM